MPTLMPSNGEALIDLYGSVSHALDNHFNNMGWRAYLARKLNSNTGITWHLFATRRHKGEHVEVSLDGTKLDLYYQDGLYLAHRSNYFAFDLTKEDDLTKFEHLLAVAYEELSTRYK